MSQEEIYNKYHKDPKFQNLGKGSYQGDKVRDSFGKTCKTVLDFGCGSGYAVRGLRGLGFDASGYEYSVSGYEKYLKGDEGFYNRIESLIGRKYDLIYSTEVLEHIPEEMIDTYMKILYDICGKYVFMTISLRPSSDNNAYHCTLKSREWWEDKFTKHGFKKIKSIVDKYQKVSKRSTVEILSQWSNVGEFGESFAKKPPYELYGEEQPWFFAFGK
ncbi:MAG: class I SAM-dependent methyltransferase [Promethearchaeota archaeon]|jgi:SAM-dependent methyltransferase